MSDESLARQAAAGQVDAFWELYRRYRAAVYSFALRLLGDEGLAEDVAQEAFLAAYKNIRRYDEQRGRFISWLLAIAHHECCRVRRRRRRLVFVSGGEKDDEGLGVESRAVDPDPDHAIDLERALARVPESFRVPIVLTKLQGLSLAECAAVLGISETNVKQRVFRGFKVLRRLVAEPGLQPGRRG